MNNSNFLSVTGLKKISHMVTCNFTFLCLLKNEVLIYIPLKLVPLVKFYVGYNLDVYVVFFNVYHFTLLFSNFKDVGYPSCFKLRAILHSMIISIHSF